MQRRHIVHAAVILAAMLAGCTDLSNRTLPNDEPTELFTADNDAVTSQTSAESMSYDEIYSEYPFTPENEERLSHMVFVGDNLCLGLAAYGIVTHEQVIADENATAVNIADISVSYGGGSVDVLTALVNVNPSDVVTMLGSNYLEIENTDEYIAKYMEFITLAVNYCPNANFTVLAAPPVNSMSVYKDSETIAKYNTALKKAVENLNKINVKFIDIGVELKNAGGELKTNYGTGDGLLLTERGYHAVLWQICNY